MKVSKEHVTSRLGINACQAFFEKHSCVFLEVPQQSDFGKDAYVDLTHNGVLSGICVALQIKSGPSYRSNKGDYFIPIGDHAEVWRNSTVPVFGIVHDPEIGTLAWTDLTSFLRDRPEQESGSILVSSASKLDDNTLFSDFLLAAERHRIDQSKVSLRLLTKGVLQSAAVRDAWILGRHDARYLILLRRLVLDLGEEALRYAIVLLSHAPPHPDIFWTKDNWIPPAVAHEAQTTFRWAVDELARFIGVIDVSDYGRGTIGQCLDVLLYEDPTVVEQLHSAVGLLLAQGKKDCAVRAASLLLSHSKDGRTDLFRLKTNYPALMEHEWFIGIAETVRNFGKFWLY